MGKLQLVIMAAGLGSRFGGLKQIAPIDDAGHLIIDFSIYDAVRAGFDEVICIVKPEHERAFRLAIGDRIDAVVKVRYAHQSIDRLPAGFSRPAGREKPWGTGHALLCAADQIEGACAVINADDFYGREAFLVLAQFLRRNQDANRHALVGYRVENTMTEHGSVARGVCSVQDGLLTGVVERTRVEPCPGGAHYTEDGGATYTFLPAGTTVSMNLWGFMPSILAEFERRFPAFLEQNLPINPLKCEYFLPLVPNQLIEEGRARFAVLSTDARWYGVTYQQDMPGVKHAIAALKADGIYPERLWSGARGASI